MTLSVDLLDGRAFNFLTLAFAFLGLVAGAIGVYIAIKAFRAKSRRLTIAALPAAPLLTQYSERVSDLRVEYNKKVLANPQIVTFTLENFGDVAIDSSCFDQARPIKLDVGVPVLEVLKISLNSGGTSKFAYTKKKTYIALGPDVLKPRQRLTVQLLVEGEPVLRIEDHMANTDVEHVFPGNVAKFEPRPMALRLMHLSWILPIAAFGGAALVDSLQEDAVIRFDPANAVSGQEVTVTGSGFNASDPVEVSVMCGYGDPFSGGGATIFPIVQVPASATGELNAIITIPKVPGLKDCRLNGWQPNDSRWKVKNASRDFS